MKTKEFTTKPNKKQKQFLVPDNWHSIMGLEIDGKPIKYSVVIELKEPTDKEITVKTNIKDDDYVWLKIGKKEVISEKV